MYSSLKNIYIVLGSKCSTSFRITTIYYNIILVTIKFGDFKLPHTELYIRILVEFLVVCMHDGPFACMCNSVDLDCFYFLACKSSWQDYNVCKTYN